MSKAVLISIRPKWCELIANGKKTIEVRKTRPKLDTPFKCYIYCTLEGSREFFHSIAVKDGMYEAQKKWYREDWYERKGNVIGEFVCDRISTIAITDEGYDFDCPKMTGLSYEAMADYLNQKEGYGWHISELKIYDKTKELCKFIKPCPYEDVSCIKCEKSGFGDYVYCENRLTRPPQSWCYVAELRS